VLALGGHRDTRDLVQPFSGDVGGRAALQGIDVHLVKGPRDPRDIIWVIPFQAKPVGVVVPARRLRLQVPHRSGCAAIQVHGDRLDV